MKRKILSLLLAFTLFFSTLSAFVNPVYATNSLDIDEQELFTTYQPYLSDNLFINDALLGGCKTILSSYSGVEEFLSAFFFTLGETATSVVSKTFLSAFGLTESYKDQLNRETTTALIQAIYSSGNVAAQMAENFNDISNGLDAIKTAADTGINLFDSSILTKYLIQSYKLSEKEIQAVIDVSKDAETKLFKQLGKTFKFWQITTEIATLYAIEKEMVTYLYEILPSSGDDGLKNSLAKYLRTMEKDTSLFIVDRYLCDEFLDILSDSITKIFEVKFSGSVIDIASLITELIGKYAYQGLKADDYIRATLLFAYSKEINSALQNKIFTLMSIARTSGSHEDFSKTRNEFEFLFRAFLDSIKLTCEYIEPLAKKHHDNIMDSHLALLSDYTYGSYINMVKKSVINAINDPSVKTSHACHYDNIECEEVHPHREYVYCSVIVGPNNQVCANIPENPYTGKTRALSSCSLCKDSCNLIFSNEYTNSEYFNKLINVMLTGDYAKDLVAVALSQVGYHEGNSPSDLNGENQSGTKNYSEYGYAFGNPNGEWCAYFISWCARYVGIPSNMLKSSAMAGPDDFGVAFHKSGTYTPSAGDLVFFGNSIGPYAHVGIVVSADDKQFSYVAGNEQGVAVRKYQMSYSWKDTSGQYISGFGSWKNNDTFTNDISVETIFVEPTYITLPIGGSFTLEAVVSPQNAKSSVVWLSSNASIASVNANGLVEAHTAGKTTVTVQSKDGKKTDSITIHVLDISYDTAESWTVVSTNTAPRINTEIAALRAYQWTEGSSSGNFSVAKGEKLVIFKKVTTGDGIVWGFGYGHNSYLGQNIWGWYWLTGGGYTPETYNGLLIPSKPEDVMISLKNDMCAVVTWSSAMNATKYNIYVDNVLVKSNITATSAEIVTTDRKTMTVVVEALNDTFDPRIISVTNKSSEVYFEFPQNNATTNGRIDNFKKSAVYNQNYTDISDNAWYLQNVKSVYEYGLMIGSNGLFKPNDQMSVAEALTIACRLHNIYNEIDMTFGNTHIWYQPYVDYAIDKGFIVDGQFSDYSKKVTRAEIVSIFASALSMDAFVAINRIPYGAIPDIANNMLITEDVYLFYNAGILAGSDHVGTFYPNRTITRAEIAAIVTRIADPSLRLHVVLN